MSYIERLINCKREDALQRSDEYNASSQERIRVYKMERRPRSQYEKENTAYN